MGIVVFRENKKGHLFCRVSDSPSFNAKMTHYLYNTPSQNSILSLGASITLNNIDSKVMVNHFGNNYYNLSSWGLQVSDARSLANYFFKQIHPKMIVMCSSMGDFREKYGPKLPEYKVMDRLINSKLMRIWYSINIPMLDNLSLYKQSKEDGSASLKLDKFGGCQIDVIITDIEKFKPMNFPTQYTDFQYDELEKLCLDCKKNSCVLVFIQSPLSPDFMNKPAETAKLYKHNEKCKQIITKNGQVYLEIINNKGKYINTDYLTDQAHMSSQGAKKFTAQVVAMLDSLGCSK